ncbi:hypothetical protein ElyMa_004815700 [Elysia marginata]|uniref:Uncharacterized protein n=1 Tax=Elysia marginata TaxID=1093978 RepID=A0AAV4IKV0_9GAST|nr:hypothetical protein ElyMa_004815700 [Elysia marginata]
MKYVKEKENLYSSPREDKRFVLLRQRVKKYIEPRDEDDLAHRSRSYPSRPRLSELDQSQTKQNKEENLKKRPMGFIFGNTFQCRLPTKRRHENAPVLCLIRKLIIMGVW